MMNLHAPKQGSYGNWPLGSGEMAERIRVFNWAQTPLGALTYWPQSLKTATELMLAMKNPVCIGYGTHFYLLYNDAYMDLLADSHPFALGQPYAGVWSAHDGQNERFIQTILAGESVFAEDQPFRQPGGYLAQPARWITHSWTPLRDEEGAVKGFYGAAMETTGRVLTEHALQTVNERLEQQVAERTDALLQSKQLLQATLDSALYTIQAFKAIRNESGKIIDFRRILTNRAWNNLYHDVAGKSLLQENPAVVKTGMFDKFVQVTETGLPVDQELYHSQEQFEGWYRETMVKMDDGFLINSEDITERKLAQLQVQQSRELLQAVIDSSLNMIQVFRAIRNSDGKIIDFEWILINHVSERYFGQVTGKRLLEHSPGVVAEGVFDRFKQVAETGQPQQYEKQYLNEQISGWFYQSVVKLNDGVVTSTSNITARKLAEQDLQLQKERLQSVFDTSLIGMSILKAERDDEGRIQDFRLTLVNKELERETGRTDLVGKLYAQEYPGIKASGLFDIMLRVMETGQPQGTEYFYPHEGFNKWFSCMFMKADDGLIATNLDISERKNAEDERLKTLVLMEQAEQVAQTGSWEYDIRTARFTWSAGMYRLFELPPQSEVRPETYLKYVVPESQPTVLRMIGRIKTGQAVFEDSINFNINGRIKTLKVRGTVFYDDNGQPVKLLGIDMDITTMVAAEERLRQAEARQQQEIFRTTLATQEEERRRIAESLHNGLGQVLYGAKLALHHINLKQSATLQENQEALQQAEKLIADCIRESRRISHELTPTVLEDYGLKEAVQDICQRLSGPVHFSCSVTGFNRKEDKYLETAVYRIVQELMTNVAKHAGATRSTTWVQKTNEAVVIKVEDDGKGMAVAGEQSNGIGLRNIRSRVALLGGKLHISPAGDRGTVVSVTLPLAQQDGHEN